VVESFRLRVESDIGAERMVKNQRLIDNSFALHEVMKQTADGLYCGTLSRRDNTLLTVGFSLRTKQEQTPKVPQGRHLTVVESFRLRIESNIGNGTDGEGSAVGWHDASCRKLRYFDTGSKTPLIFPIRK
jgi:hypothetical protein